MLTSPLKPALTPKFNSTRWLGAEPLLPLNVISVGSKLVRLPSLPKRTEPTIMLFLANPTALKVAGSSRRKIICHKFPPSTVVSCLVHSTFKRCKVPSESYISRLVLNELNTILTDCLVSFPASKTPCILLKRLANASFVLICLCSFL